MIFNPSTCGTIFNSVFYVSLMSASPETMSAIESSAHDWERALTARGVIGEGRGQSCGINSSLKLLISRGT